LTTAMMCMAVPMASISLASLLLGWIIGRWKGLRE
jgi:hypothetical protein